MLTGRHAVLEALRRGRPLGRVYVLEGEHHATREVVALAREQGVPVVHASRSLLDRLAPGHRGVAAVVHAAPYRSLDEVLSAALRAEEAPFLLALAGVQDPVNVGSLLRSGAGAGIHGLILPAHRAAGLTGTVAKVAAGALEHVPVARVTNLAQALQTLKEQGLWVVGATPDGPALLYDVDLTVPLTVVIGGEGKGLTPRIAALCDVRARLPMSAPLGSLNAAVAGAVVLYEVRRQRLRTARR